MKACLEKSDTVLLPENLPERNVSALRHGYRTLRNRLGRYAQLWCVKHAGPRGFGRIAARLACWNMPPYHFPAYLADLAPCGFVAPGALLFHPDIRSGKHVYIGSGVMISRLDGGGRVELADKVHLFGQSFLETGSGARISIGSGTHVQPGCHLHAHLSSIHIGAAVEIAANCGFFSYDHGMEPGRLIMEQPLKSGGDIVIGNGAWLGYGVTVLQGVRIGAGAVIGAGSVVTRDIPENAIAAGVPAKVIKFRSGELAGERRTQS